MLLLENSYGIDNWRRKNKTGLLYHGKILYADEITCNALSFTSLKQND